MRRPLVFFETAFSTLAELMDRCREEENKCSPAHTAMDLAFIWFGTGVYNFLLPVHIVLGLKLEHRTHSQPKFSFLHRLLM